MQIRTFKETIEIGSGWPACLRVQRIGTYSENLGVYARVYTGKNRAVRIELRKKDNEHALFVFLYDDMKLPKGWEDSEIVWSLENDNVKT